MAVSKKDIAVRKMRLPTIACRHDRKLDAKDAKFCMECFEEAKRMLRARVEGFWRCRECGWPEEQCVCAGVVE